MPGEPRRGRQVIATLQAAGWAGTCRAFTESGQRGRKTCGLNSSFAVKATSPPLPAPETPVLPQAPFTGHGAERRENYAEIMVLIMGWQAVAKCLQHLQMSRRGMHIPHARECSDNSSVPRPPSNPLEMQLEFHVSFPLYYIPHSSFNPRKF